MPNNHSPQFAQIVYALPVDQEFTYEIPEQFEEFLCPGYRVIAPFGKRTLTGYVVKLASETKLEKLKKIEDVLDPFPLFSQEMLALTQWIAEYYFASWGEVLEAALPAGINKQSHRQVELVENLDMESIYKLEHLTEKQKVILDLLNRVGSQRVNQLEKKLGKSKFNYSLNKLEKEGLISIENKLYSSRINVQYIKHFQIAESFNGNDDFEKKIKELEKRSPVQVKILKELAGQPAGMPQSELLKATQSASSAIRALLKKGLISEEKREIFRDESIQYELRENDVVDLNADQVSVMKQLNGYIESSSFVPTLLHGVTGSGKTQIYIETLKQVRKKGKDAIVLVPEISLTPQTVSSFKTHFGNDVAVLHSRMSGGERYDSWRKIQSGKVNIVIGARSAILAPLQNIGLIVVDEEHESSYKQNDPSPRYHARDVALVRGKMNNALVILGSATPGIESFYNAKTRKYRLLQLPNRVEELPLPKVEIVDMKEELHKNRGKSALVFSERLLLKIEEKIELGEQIILLQNRRGFSTFILCRDCGHVENCKNCNITLTYHLRQHLLLCHYCDYQKQAPKICPQCQGVEMAYRGAGTQRVEEELKQYFPKIRVIRMDMDTTSRKGSHHRIIQDFRNGKYDVLLGTQMVAKGLDFPKVTLVGVISADTTLMLPDFRSSERAFQLFTQVAGRSGRKGKQGEVIIQTYDPRNHSIIFAQKHDYLRFFAKEIRERQELYYPPYSRLISIEFRGKKEHQVDQVANEFAKSIPPAKFFRLLGPAPAPLSKLKNEFRYQVLLKYDKEQDPNGSRIRQQILPTMKKFSQGNRQSVKIALDIDPVDLF